MGQVLLEGHRGAGKARTASLGGAARGGNTRLFGAPCGGDRLNGSPVTGKINSPAQNGTSESL